MPTNGSALPNAKIVLRSSESLAEFSSKDLQAMTARLKVMVQGGKRLTDQEAQALAAFSVATDLNPFVGESVYIPGSGPTIGKQGYRKKAQEQLEFEAERAGYRNPVVIREEVRDALPGETDAGEGDVAVIITITDTMSRHQWLAELNEMASAMSAAGTDDAWRKAADIIGQEPSWSGIGVVGKDEKFGRSKYDRRERAEHRAMKQAIKKRFPRIQLPEVDVVPDWAPREVKRELPERSDRTPEQLIEEMGFDSPKGETVEAEVVDVTEVEAPPEQPLTFADVALFSENAAKREKFWLDQYRNGESDGLVWKDAVAFANKGLADEIAKRAKSK